MAIDGGKGPSIFLFAGSDLVVHAGPVAATIHGLDEEEARGLPVRASRDYVWAGGSFQALALDEDGEKAALARGLVRLPIRQAIGMCGAEELRPLLKGLALLNWLEGARHCGACGAPLADIPSDGSDPELSESGGRVCPACKRPHFPRISPAVIVLVRRAGKALLARNARVPPGGRFGLLAGFVEAGETLEEAAVREVREEAGIEIGNLRYVRSQPWPFPDSLMLAFTADWLGGEARPDGAEIAELRWCGPDELPEIPPPGSVAFSLIDAFVHAGRADSAAQGDADHGGRR